MAAAMDQAGSPQASTPLFCSSELYRDRTATARVHAPSPRQAPLKVQIGLDAAALDQICHGREERSGDRSACLTMAWIAAAPVPPATTSTIGRNLSPRADRSCHAAR